MIPIVEAGLAGNINDYTCSKSYSARHFSFFGMIFVCCFLKIYEIVFIRKEVRL